MRVARITMGWDAIASIPYPKKFPNGAFHWVNDQSIADRLVRGKFEDVSKDINRQPGVHDHAARIATLVTMIQSGVELKRIHIHITKKHINIEDGNHRFRAYQYCGKSEALRLYVTGRIEVLSMASAHNPSFFWHGGTLTQVRNLER